MKFICYGTAPPLTSPGNVALDHSGQHGNECVICFKQMDSLCFSSIVIETQVEVCRTEIVVETRCSGCSSHKCILTETCTCTGQRPCMPKITSLKGNYELKVQFVFFIIPRRASF